MKHNVKTSMLSIVVLGFCLMFLSGNVYASSISAVKTSDTNFIVYVENQNDIFEYGFSKSDDTKPSSYEIASQDANGSYVIVINENNLEYAKQNPYIWINDKDGNNISISKLNLEDYINYQDTLYINNITKRIDVTTDEVSKNVTDSENKITTVTTGKTVITDDDTKTYKYSLIKLPGNELVNSLVDVVDKINTFNTNTDMYTATTTYKSFKKLYEQVINEASFLDVEDMTILQPEDSVNGDRYVLLLRKMDGTTIVEDDMQILVCKRVEDEGVDQIVKIEEVERPVKLPVTGDNVVLIASFIALIIALIVLVVLKTRLNKKSQE